MCQIRMNEALGAIAALTAEVDLAEGIMDENPTEDADMTATSHVKKEILTTSHVKKEILAPTPAAAQIAPTAEIASTADTQEVAEVADASTTETMGDVTRQIDSDEQDKEWNGNVRNLMSATLSKHSIDSEAKR